MTSFEPELWVSRAAEAVEWYGSAFGAREVLRVGGGDDIVARLEIEDARFWVSAATCGGPRYSPEEIRGTTGRLLLVVEDPDALQAQAVAVGAVELSPVAGEHGWRVGRVKDPFGHEWELGRPSS